MDIDRSRLAALLEDERRLFVRTHPRSAEMFARASRHLLGGVPMTWMRKWAGGFPVFAEEARGSRVRDVDGRDYLDLCLGDTGAMAGHSPPAAIDAIVDRARKGLTLMLPTEDSIWVGEEMAHRFGLPFWQFTLSATDANRFALRIAREITGRPKVLVFHHCYHGTVDETFAVLGVDGHVGPRRGNVGPPVDPALTTKVVEWNDITALETALLPRDVACVLAEPALTNVGIVLPEPGFHAALREITRRTGTLLILDETHTLSAGPGGYTGVHGLEPDLLTLGKPIGGGIPVGAFGCSAEVSRRVFERRDADYWDAGGVGGTLAGNALCLAAVRATLEHVLTPEAHARMTALAGRFAAGVASVVNHLGLSWHVTQLGGRAEYMFGARPPRNGREAAAARDSELEDYMHLFALNRGILLTPFHNMALMSPATTEADVDHHTAVFAESVSTLAGRPP